MAVPGLRFPGSVSALEDRADRQSGELFVALKAKACLLFLSRRTGSGIGLFVDVELKQNFFMEALWSENPSFAVPLREVFLLVC